MLTRQNRALLTLFRISSVVSETSKYNFSVFLTLSGYGSTAKTVARAISHLSLPPLEEWTDNDISTVVKAFSKAKFPTVLALNKMDHPDADKNVTKILKKHPDSKAVLTSAITEVFIRKLAKQGYVLYEEGTEFLDTKDDLPDSELKVLDDKLRA